MIYVIIILSSIMAFYFFIIAFLDGKGNDASSREEKTIAGNVGSKESVPLEKNIALENVSLDKAAGTKTGGLENVNTKTDSLEKTNDKIFRDDEVI